MNKVLLVDFDGVMCDMLTPVIAIYNRQHHHYTGEMLSIKDITDWVLPAGMKEIFMHTPNFFADLKPHEGAIEGVTYLARHFKVYFVTDALSNPNIARDKLRWREKYELTNIPIIITGDKALINGDIIIDDAPHHLKNFISSGSGKVGISVDLKGAPYTQKLDQDIKPFIKTAKSWDEILDRVYEFSVPFK